MRWSNQRRVSRPRVVAYAVDRLDGDRGQAAIARMPALHRDGVPRLLDDAQSIRAVPPGPRSGESVQRLVVGRDDVVRDA